MKTILVIDDEKIIRELAHQILERAGYDVLSADSGESGLALLQQQDTKVDLAITDFRMEGVCGIKLLAQIRMLFPELPIIVSSGIKVEDSVVVELVGPKPNFLPKPYRPSGLIDAVTKTFGIPEAAE